MSNHRPIKKFTTYLIISITTALIIFAVDMVMYGFALPDLFNMDGMKDMPDFPTMIVAYLLSGLTFAYVFSLLDWSKGLEHASYPVLPQKPFWYGGLLAMLIFLPGVIFDHALFNGSDIVGRIVEFVYRFILFGVLAVVATAISHKLNN